MVFQDPDTQIIADTVFDETAFGPENLNMGREEINGKVNKVLTLLDLDHLRDRNPATLSGGGKAAAGHCRHPGHGTGSDCF